MEKLEVTEDTAGATSVTSNRSASNKSEFEFVDNFKTPFSLRGQTPVSGRPVMMQPGAEASVTATKDLSDFFEETRRAKDLPVLLGANENVERGEMHYAAGGFRELMLLVLRSDACSLHSSANDS